MIEENITSGTVICTPKNPASGLNTAEGYMAACSIIETAVIQLRPTSSYDGSFGFDWLRLGDTNLFGDVPYNTIMGHTDYNNINHLDSSKYSYLKDSFEKIPHPSIKDENYYIPVLSLNKGNTATLSLKISYDVLKTSKIKVKYNANFFSLNFEEITFIDNSNELITTASGEFETQFTITAKSTRSSNEYIEFYLDKNEKDPVGKLKIIPNNSSKQLEVIFIHVKTKLDLVERTGSILSNEIDLCKNILSQSHIDYNYTLGELDLIEDSTLRDNYTQHQDGAKVYKTFKDNTYSEYIISYFDSKVSSNFSSHYRIYLVDEPIYNNLINDYSYGNARGLNTNSMALFIYPRHLNQNGSKTRPHILFAHEFLHALGLRHTFDRNSQISCLKNRTDNVADYTYQISKKAFSTWQWQWALMNPALKEYIKPTSTPSV